jgi:hypothetical protein
VRAGPGRSFNRTGILFGATWLSHLEFDWDSPVWRHLLHAMSDRGTFVRYENRAQAIVRSREAGFGRR